MTKAKASIKTGGRPRFEITSDLLQEIKTLAGYGLPEERIADWIGISPRTLMRRKKDTEAVAKAVSQGKAVAEASVGRSLYEQAIGGSVSAIIWWEKTRAGRVETRALDIARAETEKAMIRFFEYLQTLLPEDQFETVMERYQAYLDEAEEKANTSLAASKSY